MRTSAGHVKIERDCPFCGQSHSMYIAAHCIMADLEKPWYVECAACGGRTGFFRDKEGAVRSWNGVWGRSPVFQG